MVDRYVVRARIAKIREYVTLLRKIRGMADERRFVSDPLVYGNAERYLQLAIQAVLDVSNHIVADMNLNLPADTKELFEVLAKLRSIGAEVGADGGFQERVGARVPGNRPASRLRGLERRPWRFRAVHQSRQQVALMEAFD